MTPFKKNRTPSKYIYYALQLYISGLSLRKTSKRLSQFVKRNHISIWNGFNNGTSQRRCHYRRKEWYELIIDEILLKVGENYVWFWFEINWAKHNSLPL